MKCAGCGSYKAFHQCPQCKSTFCDKCAEKSSGTCPKCAPALKTNVSPSKKAKKAVKNKKPKE